MTWLPGRLHGLAGALVCMVLHWTLPGTESTQLSPYILDYQPVSFDHTMLHAEHARVRREVDQYLHWEFKAYGRTFKLRLAPAESMFASDHVLVFGSEAPQAVDTIGFYDGFLQDVPGSSAHLSIREGGVSGYVKVPGDTTYHIEPARNHLKNAKFHTIIYPESKMVMDPFKHLRQGSCGDEELFEKLKNMSEPAEPPTVSSSQNFEEQLPWQHNKYSAAFNDRGRQKRNTETGNLFVDNKRTCFMSLQADQLLYNHVLQRYSGEDQQTAEQHAKEELLTLFNSHIKALNSIYSVTKFHATNVESTYFEGIRFQLQRSIIITACGNGVPSGYCLDNLDVSNFLDLTSKANYDEFCLVHTFTYRDFVGGTLGLAWVAAPNSGTSGFCGKYGNVRSDSGVSKKSLNTGIVTFINFGHDIPQRISQLTFAHEVGHNFGSQHDPKEPSKCSPYKSSLPQAEGGNYIMFPSATPGDKANNGHFSPCSKNYIYEVLITMAPRGGRYNCFKASTDAFCGNNVVEGDEQCDCGYENECEDKCCYGRTDDESKTCQLKINMGYVCSPTAGSCCNNDCTHYGTDHVCAQATECAMEAKCLGNNYTCPEPEAKPDYRDFCDERSKVCEKGQCTGSVCKYIGWTECFKTSAEGASDEEMCYVSCQKTENSACLSSYNQADVDANPEFKKLLDDIKNNTGSGYSGVQRMPGYFCDDFKGYCDMFGKCQKVDAEGPFKQLTDMIFDPVTLGNVRDWIVDHWWAVLLMAVGVVVFMGVFVKIFSYNTPSKNPKYHPRATRATSSQPARSRPQPDKRSGAYSVDVPMHDRRRPDQGQGHINYGYQQPPLPPHDPPPYHARAQHFDRIAHPGQRY